MVVRLVVAVALLGVTGVSVSMAVASAQTWSAPAPGRLSVVYIPGPPKVLDTASQSIQLTVIEPGQTPPTSAPRPPDGGAGAGAGDENAAGAPPAGGAGGGAGTGDVTTLPRTGPNDRFYWMAFIGFVLFDAGLLLSSVSRSRTARPHIPTASFAGAVT